MEKLAALNGEVVTIAVDLARGRVVACTSDCNAAVLEHDEPSEDSASLVRSALEGMKADWSPDLHAAFIAGPVSGGSHPPSIPGPDETGLEELHRRIESTGRDDSADLFWRQNGHVTIVRRPHLLDGFRRDVPSPHHAEPDVAQAMV